MITPFQTRAAERRVKITAEIDAAKKTLEDATTVGAGFWVSYIFLMFYIAVSAGAVTHADLLLENPVKLPFLNLDLPLVGFFFLAPILFIVMHVFTLSKLVMLAEKAKRFLEALEKLPKAEAREKLRRSLPSNIFTQFMAGPTEISRGGFGALLRLMGWITMALAPVLLLLFLQIQFLPYHSLWLTWEHRAALAIDLALLWWLWRRALNTAMLARPAPAGLWENAKYLLAVTGRAVALIIGLALSAGALFASLVATYPTEWKSSPLAFAPRLDARRAALTEAIFGENSSCARGRDVAEDKAKIAQVKKVFGMNAPFPRWPCNTLYLEEFDIFEALKIEDPNKLGGREFTVRLRARRLEGANLAYAKLGKADLRDAKLMGARLYYAELQGATLDKTELQGATLDKAELQGATLELARLQGATLYGAKLQGAALDFAQLQGASLDEAELQGATLKYAQLQGTSLDAALVWRAGFDYSGFSILFPEPPKWKALAMNMIVERPWTQSDYEKLKSDLIAEIPEGDALNQALKRIDKLSCEKEKGKIDCRDNPSDEEKTAQHEIEAAIKSTTREAYAAALTDEFKPLVCSGDEKAIYILRGLMASIENSGLKSRFAATAANAPNLVDDILNPKTTTDCPVSADLTASDKARLHDIKKWAEKNYPPKPAPKADATRH